MSNKTQLLPSTFEEITPSWISSVLDLKHPINSASFKLNPNANEGNGFLSTLVRVEFELDVNNGAKPEKYSLIVKLVPDSSISGQLDLVLTEKLDQTELRSYTDFFKDVLKEIPDFHKYVCEHYYASIQEADPAKGIPYASVIILKDLRPDGFAIIPFRDGYEPSLFAEGLDAAAKLHVGSRCMERERGIKLPEAYPWLAKWFLPIEKQRPGYVLQLESFYDEGFEATYKALNGHSKTPEKYVDVYKAFEPRAKELYQMVLRAGQNYQVGIHGDLWGPNILINQESKDSRMKIIDWQFFGYADPTFDMAIYIMTLLPLETLNPTGIKQAAKDYYAIYTELCKSKNLEVERTLEKFLEDFHTYGIAYYLYVCVLGCHLLAGMDGAMPKLLRLLELFVEMGVIDFLMRLP